MTYQGIPVREHVCSLDGGGEVLIREWQGGRVEAAWRPNPDAVWERPHVLAAPEEQPA